MAENPSMIPAMGMTPEEKVYPQLDPLLLDVSDVTLVKAIDAQVKASRDYFRSQKDLFNRQQKNFDYWKGKQWDEKELQRYNARYIDNLIYESQRAIKPVAFSHMPDLTVKAGAGRTDPNALMDAKDLSAILTDQVKKRDMRQTIAIASKHIPVYFLGAIKPYWDPEIGKEGDYDFDWVLPSKLIIDPTANSLDVTKHKFLGQVVSHSVKQLIMRFPKKEKEILSVTQISQDDADKEKKLMTQIDYIEMWFTWYEQEKDQYKRIEGVCWKYKDLILGKMKDPNWDWEGEDRLFSFDLEKMSKQPVPKEGLQDALLHTIPDVPPGSPMDMPMTQNMGMSGFSAGMTKEKVYHNHFQSPRKPFILLGYDQWGEVVYDETSWIEQVIPLQDNVNVRGRQITEIANRVRGKDIFSVASGLKKKDIENLDMNDPDTDLLVKGNPKDVHEHIDAEQPKPSLFQDQTLNRERLLTKAGVHGTMQGIKTSKSAQQAQMIRETEYGQIDDFAEDVINYASEQIGNWSLQFIKLRYTVDHFRTRLGPDGEHIFQRVNRDMVHDQMEVVVSTSAVDKVMRKREAYERVKMKMTDPLTFFEDIDVSNPKERSERLMLFAKQPDMYYRKYIKGDQSIQDTANALQGTTQPGGGPTPNPMGMAQPQQQALNTLAAPAGGPPSTMTGAPVV